MSGSQRAVLWMGFGLIILRLLTGGRWSALWATLKTGTPIDQGSSPALNSQGGAVGPPVSVTPPSTATPKPKPKPKPAVWA